MIVAADRFNDKRTALYGITCLAGLGVFLVWAVFAPLEEGVTASGNVAVDSNRKEIQHLEGGIVRKVYVKEGSQVHQGELLVQLDDLRARAQRDQAAQDVATLELSQARLEAFLEGRDSMETIDLKDLQLNPRVEAEIRRRQADLFKGQQRWLSADQSLIRSKQSAMVQNGQSRGGQIKAAEDALAAAHNELDLNERLLTMKLTHLDHVLDLRKQVASMESDVSRLKAERDQDLMQASVFDNESVQSRSQILKDSDNELLQVKTELLSTEEKLRSAEDVLERTRIYAPRAGAVMNLGISTVGGVVQPGERIMEIVPSDTHLVATVRVKPTDRDSVFEGEPIKAQISAFASWKTPRIGGKVIMVSPDLKEVKENGAPYYEARIELDPTVVNREHLLVRPGMPVEAFIDTGRSRTMIDYLFEPLIRVVSHGALARK